MAIGKAEWFCKTENLIYALLAQLVEQLTLNQRAQGSSPWKCTTKRQDVCPAFFVALPPYGGGFTVRAAGAPVKRTN